MSLKPTARVFVPKSKQAPPAGEAAPVAAAPKVLDLSAPAPVAATPAATSTPATVVKKSEETGDWEHQADKAKDSNATKSTAATSTSQAATPSAAPTTNSTSETNEEDDEFLTDDVKRELAEIAAAEEEAGLCVADEREHLNIVFIGHVDAGKSTISGQLLLQSGQIDARTIEKYEREAKELNRGSWFYAFIMDTGDAERVKGITQECGRAHFATEKKRYTILDAPGHKAYVPSMIAGATQADVALLLISARQGEFEAGFDKGGQTREHSYLAKTSGINRLIVIINKMDECNWSKDRFNEIVSKLTPFLRRECGYGPNDFQFIPISAFNNLNIGKPITDLCPWYEGLPLIPMLDSLPPFERDEKGPLRLPINDKFKDMGVTHILGKIEVGTVHKGQQLMIMPSRLPLKVAGVYINAEDEVPSARAGDNIRLAVTGVEEHQFSSGYVLCEAARELAPVVTEFEAQLAILDLPFNPLFTAGYEAVMHIHSAQRECVIQDLIAEIDRKTKQKSKRKPAFVKAGAVVFARILISQPVCLEVATKVPALGRFTLRDKGKTIAVGKVTKIVGTAN